MAQELKREFSTMGEAFNALPLRQRQHGERVGEYLRVIFLQACSLEVFAFNTKAAARMKEEYGEMMPLIGCCHDVGKVLVAEEYHDSRDYFSEEETALYRRHPIDSAKLLRELLRVEKLGAQGKRFAEEGLRSHHEHWDGSGFPEGLKGQDIPVYGRLLAVADALDHYSAEKRSEQPLEFALAKLQEGAGTLYDPEIVEILSGIRGKLRRVFNAYIEQTRAIPTTETLVRRTGIRPFELRYSPFTAQGRDDPVAYQAEIFFRRKREWFPYEREAELIRREKLGPELGEYMLLEACDTINRLDACGIPAEFMALELPAGWLNRRTAHREVAQALEDTGVSAGRLAIELGARTLAGRTKTMEENLRTLRELGCRILLTAPSPAMADAKELDALSASMLRFTADWLEGEWAAENEATLKQVSDRGIELVAHNVTKKRLQPTLNRLKTRYAAGTYDGNPERENELVERELAAQELRTASEARAG